VRAPVGPLVASRLTAVGAHRRDADRELVGVVRGRGLRDHRRRRSSLVETNARALVNPFTSAAVLYPAIAAEPTLSG
jgi:hypothetical protein